MIAPDRSATRYRRLALAVCSGGFSRAVTAGATLLSLPLAVRYLGAERFGVWATITTTAVWINLLDLGVANTLTNRISRAYAHDDKPDAARAFTNALFAVTAVAGFAAVLAFAFLPTIDWPQLLNVGQSVGRAETDHLVASAVALMLLGLPCALVNKVLAGYQQLHLANYASCVGAAASLCGLGLGVALQVSMPTLFLMSAGAITLTTLLTLLAVVTFQKPWLRPRLSLIDLHSLKQLLSSGASFFMIQVAAVVVFSSDNIVVSHYLGPSEVTPYSVTWRVVGVLALLQSLLFPALWPSYAEAHARGDYDWIRCTFRFTLIGTITLNVIAGAFLAVFGRGLIKFWAGAAAVPSMPLLLAMCAWAVISGAMTVESCLLAALNRTRLQAVLSIVAAGVNIALSVQWVRQVGSLGVIGGTIVSYIVVLVLPQSLIVRSVWRRELPAGRERVTGFCHPERSRGICGSPGAAGERLGA